MAGPTTIRSGHPRPRRTTQSLCRVFTVLVTGPIPPNSPILSASVARRTPGCALERWLPERRCEKERGRIARLDGDGRWRWSRHSVTTETRFLHEANQATVKGMSGGLQAFLFFIVGPILVITPFAAPLIYRARRRTRRRLALEPVVAKEAPGGQVNRIEPSLVPYLEGVPLIHGKYAMDNRNLGVHNAFSIIYDGIVARSFEAFVHTDPGSHPLRALVNLLTIKVYTVWLAELPAVLPLMQVSPQGTGWANDFKKLTLSTGDAAFDQAFVVTAGPADHERVRRVLNEDVRRMLLAAGDPQPWRVLPDQPKPRLVMWTRGVRPPVEVVTILRATAELARALE